MSLCLRPQGNKFTGLSSQLLSRKEETLDLDSFWLRSLGGHCSKVATNIACGDINVRGAVQ